jgi:hypothetical protein
VAGDPFPLVEEFHDGRTQTDVALLAHQRIRHRGVVACHLHVIINVAPGELPLRILLGLGGQRPECRALEGVKLRLA